jgi:hypothetical protein
MTSVMSIIQYDATFDAALLSLYDTMFWRGLGTHSAYNIKVLICEKNVDIKL